MGDLSAHFDRHEFACRHCGRVIVSAHLVRHLERLRAIVGRPLVVVSGYRCPEHNRAVGGARGSLHLRGEAADLRRGYATTDQARQAGLNGIGRCGPWAVHVDVRPQPVTFHDC